MENRVAVEGSQFATFSNEPDGTTCNIFWHTSVIIFENFEKLGGCRYVVTLIYFSRRGCSSIHRTRHRPYEHAMFTKRAIIESESWVRVTRVHLLRLRLESSPQRWKSSAEWPGRGSTYTNRKIIKWKCWKRKRASQAKSNEKSCKKNLWKYRRTP